jgi:putative peptide zinc metalloprotease protein
MTRAAWRALLLVLLVAFGLVSAAPVAAQEGDSGSSGGDNTAIALNTKDGSSLFKYAFSVTKATGEVVDAGNAAVAYASCVECTTVAVAIQFVIVQGSPDTFTPENLAIAMNESCTLCETMALAYQVVIQTDGPVRLSGEGRRRLQELLLQLHELEDSGLALEELHARVEEIVHQMTEVLSTQLIPIGRPEDDAASASTAASTTTTVRDTATSTSTTEAVRSTTTTTPSGSTTTTTTTSTPSTTTTTTSTSTSTTSTTAP